MVQKEEFYFDSRDRQSKIHAVKWIPDVAKPVCIFQIIHGMEEHIERYNEFAEFLTGKGILVVGEDHLGHGKTVTDGGTYGYFCKEDAANILIRDVHRLKKIVQEQYPDVPYLILGHSLGSFILRNYLCRYGSGVNGAVIVGTGMPTKSMIFVGRTFASVQQLFLGPKHVGKLIDRLAFGSYNKKIEPLRTKYDWLSVDQENVDRYIADPYCGFTFTLNGFSTMFKLARECYNKEKIDKIPKHLPILMISGTEDPVGEYGIGVERAYKFYLDHGLVNIQMKLYENDRHELLNETDRELVYGDIYRWILQRIA
ncbi:MAG: alpha/beta fold hydrolase [Lachnospiraceae bacterium]|nr:alpha/beta fold hydrolase [Lachnospiraceae bacterium]